MLVSLGWLKDYVDVPWGPHALADRLTMSGAKVESVRTFEHRLENVVVGKIESAIPHERRAELFVCQVNLGDAALQVVSGAPNTRAGIVVPVALPGAHVPGVDGEIRVAEVQGVRSEAVLCSEKELGISDDHSGLMELPADLRLGAGLVEAMALDDPVIEFEIYPNRPDALSVVGIARETAALTGGKARFPDLDYAESAEDVQGLASVEVRAKDLCARYMARVVENVTVAPSPAWLQRRLVAAGMRPINNVVDITNFVMLELGQPLHAFDLDRLDGARIVVRRANPGESLRTIDGENRALDADDLVICDASRPVALAGVMGGADSEVTPTTRRILLESATFDPVTVRKSARRLGMRTEASHRFEKGLDPRLAELALERAARLLTELAGGAVAKGALDESTGLPPERPIQVKPRRINEILGASVSPQEMKRILDSLEFDAQLSEDASTMDVRVPWFRRDVEGEADIAEEVARIHGYDNIPPTLPAGSTLQGRLARPLAEIERIKARLVALGLHETIAYSFISPKAYDRLHLPDDHPWRASIPLKNPIAESHSVMRTTLLPSLLEAAALNRRRRQGEIALFEVGKAYVPRQLPLESLPEETWHAGVVMSGPAPTSVWGESRSVDFYVVKGVVESILAIYGVDAAFRRTEEPFLHPGRAAEVSIGDVPLGWLGEVHPSVASEYDLRGRTYVAVLDVEKLFERDRPTTRFEPLPRHPGVERDLALLVPVDVDAASVVSLVRERAGTLLRSARLFDVYEGEQVPEGYRSIGYTLTFQASDRTLTDQEIAEVHQALEKALSAELGVVIRG